MVNKKGKKEQGGRLAMMVKAHKEGFVKKSMTVWSCRCYGNELCFGK